MAGPGFVANSPSIEEPDIANSAFWPAISLTDCRAVMRIGSEITPERLREALLNGIIDTNANLTAWKDKQVLAGHTTLADVPAEAIDGDSINLTLYRRAVYNFAKAELTERYRDYDSTLQGGDRADNLDPTIDQYRRQAILAIRQISGRQRTTVELI
jgi:hypothetical protein